MNKTPFFSIVMVSYNAEKYVKKSVDSLLMQDFDDYEIIIKDACSTDNTLEILPKDSRIKMFQCRDNGIYDGMNQAIKHCNGNYLFFYNFGDEFVDSKILSNVYQKLKEMKEICLLYGNLHRDGLVYKLPNRISKYHLYRTSINHQTTFWDRRIFDKIGVYNTFYKVASDYDIECRAYNCNDIRFVHLDLPICNYLSGGFSDTPNGKKILKDDFKKIHKTYFSTSEIVKYEFLQKVSLKWLRRVIDSEESPIWLRMLYRKFMNMVTG